MDKQFQEQSHMQWWRIWYYTQCKAFLWIINDRKKEKFGTSEEDEKKSKDKKFWLFSSRPLASDWYNAAVCFKGDKVDNNIFCYLNHNLYFKCWLSLMFFIHAKLLSAQKLTIILSWEINAEEESPPKGQICLGSPICSLWIQTYLMVYPEMHLHLQATH